MKKCIDKKILFLLLILVLIFSLSLPVFGADGFDFKKAVDDADKATGVTELNETATNVTGAILDTIKTVAVGVALIMLVVIAMKYMFAAPGDRADIKKHAVPYVIGAVILFSSAAIVTIIANFANSNIKKV